MLGTIETQLFALFEGLYLTIGYAGVVIAMAIESMCIPLPENRRNTDRRRESSLSLQECNAGRETASAGPIRVVYASLSRLPGLRFSGKNPQLE